MTHVPSGNDDSLLTRAFSWIMTHRTQEGRVAGLSNGDLRNLAADLGVTQADLLHVLPEGTPPRDLMDQMIRAHGLDPAAIRALPTAMVRDMEVTCSRCQNASRCERDLKAGRAAVNSQHYCGNAPTFDAMIDARA